mmetsp:Transcript_11671/g.20775  ORF Transcript_11671/g.20775 Transcript_11671/m.20775 type:complete len:456 (+) Transcript_11671:148-1515(+)
MSVDFEVEVEEPGLSPASTTSVKKMKKEKKEKKEKREKREKKEKKERRKRRYDSSSSEDDRKSSRQKARTSDSRYPRPRKPSKLTGPSMWDKKPDQVPNALLISTGQMLNTRHARRLYVGGLEHGASEVELQNFFNDKVGIALNAKQGEEFVVSVYVNLEKKFGFVEFKTMELASACLSLDGLDFNGIPLRVRRPNDYRADLVGQLGPLPNLDLSKLRITPMNRPVAGNGPSPHIVDSANKVFVGGLPHHLSDPEITELLEAFGKLKALKVVKDHTGVTCKGYAFCEYLDPAHTDPAIQGLNGLTIGDRKLTVRRSEPIPPGPGMSQNHNAQPINRGGLHGFQAPIPSIGGETPTRILVLRNMVTTEELQDDQEYQDILEDVRTEANTHGEVKSIEIPRPGTNGDATPGVGKIFVEFASAADATAARFQLEGRTFAGNKVECNYLAEEKYARKEF